MSPYKYLFIIVGVLFCSCEYDYDANLGELAPQVVLNSVISPDSTINVSLYWSNSVSDTSKYHSVERFAAKLFEDDKLIFDEEGQNGLLSNKFRPKEGSEYRLEVDVPDYGILSAKTSIPISPEIDVEYIGVKGNPRVYYDSYYHFSVNKIVSRDPTRSVMIRAMGLYHKDAPEFSRSLYTNNSFCDQFNAVNDGYDAAIKGSAIGHDYYIRVPYNNIRKSLPLIFSVSGFTSYNNAPMIGIDDSGSPIYDENPIIGYDDFGFPIFRYDKLQPTHIVVEVITPSSEYDKYYKSAYMQVAIGDIDPPIFNDIYPISSNVDNGLGLFAGYSSSIFKIELKHDE